LDDLKSRPNLPLSLFFPSPTGSKSLMVALKELDFTAQIKVRSEQTPTLKNETLVPIFLPLRMAMTASFSV
jgi:hypothetical protein